MKIIYFILPFVLSIYSYAELNIEQINRMVEKIQQKRETKMDIDYKSIPTPFIIIKKSENKKGETIISTPTKPLKLHISAIINDSVNINGKWYSLGDSINEYKIIEIKDRFVKLKKEKNIVELFFPKKKLEIPQIKIHK